MGRRFDLPRVLFALPLVCYIAVDPTSHSVPHEPLLHAAPPRRHHPQLTAMYSRPIVVAALYLPSGSIRPQYELLEERIGSAVELELVAVAD